jgi:hypothetical protein
MCTPSHAIVFVRQPLLDTHWVAQGLILGLFPKPQGTVHNAVPQMLAALELQ